MCLAVDLPFIEAASEWADLASAETPPAPTTWWPGRSGPRSHSTGSMGWEASTPTRSARTTSSSISLLTQMAPAALVRAQGGPGGLATVPVDSDIQTV